MITTVVFDFSGVIVPSILSGWIKENIPHSSEAHEKYKKHSEKWDVEDISEEEYYALISDITGIPTEKVWETIYEKSVYHKEVVALIKRLKKKHKIVLFSDNYGPLLRKLLNTYGIEALFDEILISSEHGVKKPTHAFFQKLLDKSQAQKHELVFIDDTHLNITEAGKFGIDGILFRSATHAAKELKKRGVK